MVLQNKQEKLIFNVFILKKKKKKKKKSISFSKFMLDLLESRAKFQIVHPFLFNVFIVFSSFTGCGVLTAT